MIRFLIVSLIGVTAVAAVDVCSLTGVDGGPVATFNPFWTLNAADPPACLDTSTEVALQAAPMSASVMQRRVSIPYDALSPFFARSELWPTWNILFGVVTTNASTFRPCEPLLASFHILPNIDFGAASLVSPTIVRSVVNASLLHLSWTYQFQQTGSSAYPAFGRHDYVMQPADCGTNPNATWLYSWEKGGGPVLETNQREEEHTLLKVTMAAMDGVACLEGVWEATRQLDPATVALACGQSPSLQWAELNAGGKWV